MLLLEQKHLNLKRNHIEKIKEESAQMKNHAIILWKQWINLQKFQLKIL